MRSPIVNYVRNLIRESVRDPRKVLSKIIQLVTRPIIGITTVYPLASKSRIVRECVFNALHASNNVDLVCIKNATETLIISCKDDVISRGIYANGEFDFKKFEIAIDILKKHNIINRKIDSLIDIGANVGSICIPAIMRGYAASAIAIEPDPTNCRILRANISLNALNAEIVVQEVAVGALEDTILELELSERNWGDHRIAVANVNDGRAEGNRKKISIKSTTLDSLICPVVGDATLVWMDTQGYEGHVLKGAINKVTGSAIPMVMEFWPSGLARTGGYGLLKEAMSAYSGFYDLESPNGLQPLSSLDELFSKLSVRGSFTDLLVL